MAVSMRPVSVQSAREYREWVGRLRVGVQELQAEGAIPPMPGFDEMLELSDRLDEAMRTAILAADEAGDAKVVVTLDFDEVELRKMATVGMSMVSYIEILTTRGKLDGAPSQTAMEAIVALQELLV